MKKIITIFCLTVCMTFSACSNNTQTTENSSVVLTSETTAAETASSDANTAAEETTVSETEASETDKTDFVFDPASIDLSAAISPNEIPYGGLSGVSPQADTAYSLWQSEDKTVNIYGVMSSEKEMVYSDNFGENEYNICYVIIEHDGITDFFKYMWYGVYNSMLQITPMTDDNSTLFANIQHEGGSFHRVVDMALFKLNTEGHYEMYTPDNKALAAEMKNSVTIEVDNETQKVMFKTVDSEYTTDVSDFITEKPLAPEAFAFTDGNIQTYSLQNGEICLSISYAFFMSEVCCVNAYIDFENGSFTINRIELANPVF